MIKIYHNARCGKSRCALQILGSAPQAFEVVEYLKNPPTEAEIARLLTMLGKMPLDIVRQKEPLFQEKFKGQHHSDEAWIAIMAAHPILIERPIVVVGNKAWIARDDQSLDAIATAIGPVE